MKSKILLQRMAGVPALFLFLTVAAPLFAAEKYLSPSQIDGVALLSPPPKLGSPEQTADLALSRNVVLNRTPEAEAHAMKSAKLTLFNFAPAIGDFFQPGKFPRLEKLYEDLKPELRATINVPKDFWKRQRPYVIDGTLSVGRPEPSFSYPSGHSTTGTVQSLLLAELFPENREAILEMGRRIGWDRVVIGKHFLTDVRAGRVFGQAIFRELMKNSSFRHDLAEVKAEIHAVLQEQLETTTATP